jgi:hypothetical protein
MKRAVRATWVLVANGCVAWFMFARLQSTGFYVGELRDPESWFEFLLEVCLPIVGIILEFVNWPFAKWINIGTFTLAGCFWLAEAIWWHSDPFFGVLLIVAAMLLIVAGLTEIVYRRTKATLPARLTPSMRRPVDVKAHFHFLHSASLFPFS